MAFDPSVIGTIGPSAMPDIAGATTKAFQLKDLMQEGQLHALQLKDYKTEQADRENVKDIISKAGPIDSMAKANEVTEQIGQVNRELAMKFHQQVSQTRNEDLDTQIKQAQLQGMQVNSVLSLITPLANQLQQAGWQQGQSHQILDDAVRAKAPQLAQQLKQQHPELAQAIDQTLADPSHLTADAFMDMWKRSGEAKEQLARQNVQSEIQRRSDETEIGRRKEATYEKAVAAGIEDKEARRKAVSEGLIPDEDAQFMAKQYLTGDKSVMQNLGRGAQGSKNILKLRQAITQEARNQGLSPEQVAGRMAEFNATVAEERKIGNIAGAVEFASSELDKFIPLALKASANVSRGRFVPFTKLLQIGEKSISDPALKRLYVNTQGVLNAYDVLAARGGSDKDKREHNRQMLAVADSPEAYATALDAMTQELKVARAAGKEAKQRVASEVGGGEPETTETKTYQGKTYRLKPGADRSKKDSWELVGG
jgi:hypothetical protein